MYEVVSLPSGVFSGISLEILDLGTPVPKPVTLVPSSRFANNSDWSPDGRLISFTAPADVHDLEGASDIWVIHNK